MKKGLCAAALSLTLTGCVAPLVAGAATGAGLFGVNKAQGSLEKNMVRNRYGSESNLKYATAVSLKVRSDEVAAISDTKWNGDIVQWTATNRQGQRYHCEANVVMGSGGGLCQPVAH